MTAPSDVEDLCHKMAEIRLRMNREITNVRAETEAVTSWRHFVRMHPWLALATAAAVGYLVVPRRLRREEAAVANPTAAEEQTAVSAPTRKGPLALAFGFLGPIAVRAAQGYAVNYIDTLLSPPGRTTPASDTVPSRDPGAPAPFAAQGDPPRNGGEARAFPN